MSKWDTGAQGDGEDADDDGADEDATDKPDAADKKADDKDEKEEGEVYLTFVMKVLWTFDKGLIYVLCICKRQHSACAFSSKASSEDGNADIIVCLRKSVTSQNPKVG